MERTDDVENVPEMKWKVREEGESAKDLRRKREDCKGEGGLSRGKFRVYYPSSLTV